MIKIPLDSVVGKVFQSLQYNREVRVLIIWFLFPAGTIPVKSRYEVHNRSYFYSDWRLHTNWGQLFVSRDSSRNTQFYARLNWMIAVIILLITLTNALSSTQNSSNLQSRSSSFKPRLRWLGLRGLIIIIICWVLVM